MTYAIVEDFDDSITNVRQYISSMTLSIFTFNSGIVWNLFPHTFDLEKKPPKKEIALCKITESCRLPLVTAQRDNALGKFVV